MNTITIKCNDNKGRNPRVVMEVKSKHAPDKLAQLVSRPEPDWVYSHKCYAESACREIEFIDRNDVAVFGAGYSTHEVLCHIGDAQQTEDRFHLENGRGNLSIFDHVTVWRRIDGDEPVLLTTEPYGPLESRHIWELEQVCGHYDLEYELGTGGIWNPPQTVHLEMVHTVMIKLFRDEGLLD